MRISDGTVLTTYVDETGQRLYVDGDSWTPIPDRWVSDLKPMNQEEAGNAQANWDGGNSYGDEGGSQEGPVPGTDFTFEKPGTRGQCQGTRSLAIFKCDRLSLS